MRAAPAGKWALARIVRADRSGEADRDVGVEAASQSTRREEFAACVSPGRKEM